MKNFIKLISMLLAVFMIMSSFAVLTALPALAEDSGDEDSDSDSGGDENAAASSDSDPYLTTIYATADDKLKTMELIEELNGFQLWVDDYSGEVACVNTITGEKLFTNPYDIGASTGNSTTKEEIMSQIVLSFSLVTRPGETQTFTSYKEAVKRNQINVEKIKNGVRVEYTLGREQSKSLVPRLITKERFDQIFLTKFMEAFPNGELYADPKNATPEAKEVQKFLTRYVLYSMDPVEMTKQDRNLFGYVSDNLNKSDRDRARVIKDYPVVAKTPVYVFDPKASEVEIEECEKIIEQYCPEYTYEELEWDHSLTDYESDDQNPPVFRLAIEYKISEGGLDVRLPANGIRFNESLYTLNSIDVLPYMGAGNSAYEGYNFFPDGSGALFDFQQLNTSVSRTIKADVYGVDYAYHDITGRYQKPIRYPVFGIYENTQVYEYTRYDDSLNEVSKNYISGAIVDTIKAFKNNEDINICKGNEQALCDFVVYEDETSKEKYTIEKIIEDKKTVEKSFEDKRGFVAVIEEGDALASLTTYHAGSLSDYNTIKMSIVPRPKDAYALQDSLSVSGSNSMVHITCSRKYTDSYRLKYILLSDTPKTELEMPEGVARDSYTTYDTSWMGMAVAYRDYLYSKGILSKLTKDEIVENNIPLYIETFGAVETTKKILSVPVTVKESLTTFDEIVEMYDYLSGQGINNINFKLTGFANGGMQHSVPGYLKFERVVGGNKGFQALLDKAAEINAEEGKNIGIFPDFDLVYQLEDDIFDPYVQFEHAAKTIDDRYATRREYSATQQKQVNYFNIVISPAYFYVIYEGLEKTYADKYDNIIGISVSTLGSALNSDFDEDEPYNREDSKQFTVDAFKHFKENYGQVMTDGGNAYVWEYSDHILNVPLDSSRYIFSSGAVPFVGVVLHGSVNIAGEPLNMEGDMQYAILKAIENGASPYFILCMDNTEILKEHSDLSKYYSVRYDIWQKDIKGVYDTLNGVLGDVQDMYIIGYTQLEGGIRIPDANELQTDIYKDFLEEIKNENNASQIIEVESALKASTARKNSKLAKEFALATIDSIYSDYTKYKKDYVDKSVAFDTTYYENIKAAALIEYYAQASAIARTGEYSNDEAYKEAQKIRFAVERFNFDPNLIYDALANTAGDAQYKTEFDALAQAYTDLFNAVKAGNAANEQAALDKIAEYEADEGFMTKVEKYCTHKAVIDAKNLITKYKFGDVEKAIEIYTEKYMAEVYKSFKDIYKNGDKFTGNEDYVGYYNAYTESQALAKEIEASPVVPESGRDVEKYVGYVAKNEAFELLGLHKVNNPDLKLVYNNIKNTQTVYSDAVNAVAGLVGIEQKRIINNYKKMLEHKELAVDAVYVLAEAEGVVLKYQEGHEGDVRYIMNYDSIDSTILRQAIDCAELIINYLENVNYVELRTETTILKKNGTLVSVLGDGTEVYFDAQNKVYYSVTVEDGKYNYVIYNQIRPLQEYYDYVVSNSPVLQQKAYDMVGLINEGFYNDVQRRIEMINREYEQVEEPIEEVSRYATGNIVAVTYGPDMNTPYKTVILNYNNYAVNIVYDGREYTIPAHEFVVVN